MDTTTDTAEAASDAVVVIDEVTRRFGDDVAVADISLVVPPGTILGVIGPSGAGKTTTIRMLTGALAPTSGELRVLGKDPWPLLCANVFGFRRADDLDGPALPRLCQL